MSQIEKRGIASDAVDGTKTKFLNNQSFRARNIENNADLDLFKLNNVNEFEFVLLPKHAGSNVATESYVNSQVGAIDYIPNSEKASPNGVATLDGGGKIPSAQLPSSVMTYEGIFDASATPATPLLDGDPSADAGMVYLTTVAGSYDFGSGAIDFAVGDWAVYNGAIWENSPNSSAVVSVNGYTGVVVLDSDDVGEGLTNKYYSETLFDDSLLNKTTDNVNEGLTNLYFTELRAKTATITDMNGSETDFAPSVFAVKQYIDDASANVAVEPFTLVAGDISNSFIDLAVTADQIISVDPKGFPSQYPVDDYTLSVVANKTRITFAGDMLLLQSGDKIKVSYSV
jgi:hypothetical protein